MKTTTNYKKISSYEAKKGEFNKVLLLYSGGLDTSILIKWIKDHYKCDVITLTVDIGQNENIDAVKKKAIKCGAKKAIIVNAQEDYANNYLDKAIKANADYQGGYHLFCPLGRAIIAKVAVEAAKKEKINVIAHGCTGKGNDQVRFESYITTLNPNLKIIAPVREWSMGRKEELAYAKKYGIDVSHSIEDIYSHDENVWGTSSEGDEIESSEKIPNFDKCLKLCCKAEDAPNKIAYIKLTFEKGIPIKINGRKMPLLQIIKTLNTLGAAYGIGVLPLIEDRLFGLKVRGVYEEPGAEIIIQAHKNLEKLVSTKEENEFKTIIDQKWAYFCYSAYWYHPLMNHLNAFINSQNQKITGKVQLKLYKGKATVVAVKSDFSLLDENVASFNNGHTFNQNSAPGFIELYNLQQQLGYNKNKDA